ncbi:MAG: pyridoxal 5'-phosphate synthase glutaminase subunit PdxT [Lachnospiraceae bacterium]|nr:pyridoxal 5'-phosphate synthase glutaminase subunit PdxT [Lachnospiraceae bacterium]
MKIGILAVQGAFIEHEKMLSEAAKKSGTPLECVEIRQKKDLEGLEGLILPGGESTVQGKLMHELDLFHDLQAMIREGLPVLATCAGLILLAENLDQDSTKHLATLPVTVQRNAYGRQLGSFAVNSDIGSIQDYPLVFIRAPYVKETAPEVKVLTTVDQRIVGVEYKNQLGLAFHPEMTQDTRVHEYFLEKVKAS